MELRYLGFDQAQSRRVYKFDCKAADKSTTRFLVSVDMVLFLKHRVDAHQETRGGFVRGFAIELIDAPALCLIKT